ncbi:nuclear transport factor 2 family protein [Paenibacillus tritici]|uniref:Nuclear transport factor 2 family protein n=1 Tax=Paenibacillus tritici TaxID=1873425 RepID=A0ABX2DWD8_9BACL|nr:nuclear transport factor 2 family protein [Paenibacillus tritici]NQX48892.1 nuclear transport factor 2 family protein [Paenibacillus tritici]
MIEREQRIEHYFHSWINKDKSVLRTIFSPNIVYSECYGPEYHGLDIILKWFDDWNTRGTVLTWTVKQFIHQGRMTVVEWYFQYEVDSEIADFDGVSLIEFNTENQIVSLKEFQSKAQHYDPYT